MKQITAQHAKAIQDAIIERGKRPQARHTTVILKGCMKWLANKSASGISTSPLEKVTPAEKSRIPGEPGYLPTEKELGRLPWRLEAAQISQSTRIAGLLLCLTAQRVRTVITARKEDFLPVQAGCLWMIPRGHMKSKRFHVIPLCPATWDLVKQAMALTEGTEGWLFPQVRARKAGGPTGGHISYKPVADPLDPLDPHDFRRAFATYGESLLGNARDMTKAILDHAEGNTDVTGVHYALHDGTHFKWDVMRRWENWLLALTVDHAEPKGARLRTLLLPSIVTDRNQKVELATPAVIASAVSFG